MRNKTVRLTCGVILFLGTLFGIGFASCSSSSQYDSDKADVLAKALATPTATPKKSPTPPPETKWECKISNGAGRIFKAVDRVRDVAEAKANHECSLYSRNCYLLDCNVAIE